MNYNKSSLRPRTDLPALSTLHNKTRKSEVSSGQLEFLESSVLLVAGTAVRALPGRFRYTFALLVPGLSLLGGLSGHGSVDDLPAGTVQGKIPVLLSPECRHSWH
ncbi:hypothetical protein ACIBQ1_33805 [Nonomuraea sp. NPDC050153]|uniref:hypothetical protein n=1 Tax=Nonomuraea sp. NPDC050153 TaxID=3364359 RepID=UPI00379AF1ED